MSKFKLAFWFGPYAETCQHLEVTTLLNFMKPDPTCTDREQSSRKSRSSPTEAVSVATQGMAVVPDVPPEPDAPTSTCL